MLLVAAIGSVGFTYPRVVAREPLQHPVKIASIQGNAITLVDGRIFDLGPPPDQKAWPDVFSESDGMVDIDASGNDAAIYANQKGWICGTPWAAPIRIPLVPETVYRDRRELVALAEQKTP